MINKGKRKCIPFKEKPRYKYGVKIPRNVKEALELDKENRNNKWAEAMKLENQLLNDLEYFEFQPKNYSPAKEYQKTTLMITMKVKQDLRHKCRLVVGGHLIDALDYDIYSTTVKSISVKILQVIAHKSSLDFFCGNIGNAYVNAYTNKKVYTITGYEFGKSMKGSVVIIVQALYSLRTSSERWYTHLADTLRGSNFKLTRYDNDVWIRK